MGTLPTECSTGAHPGVVQSGDLLPLQPLLNISPPDAMESDQLLQDMHQVCKANSTGVKAGGSRVSQETEWVGRMEWNLELMLYNGDKRNFRARMR